MKSRLGMSSSKPSGKNVTTKTPNRGILGHEATFNKDGTRSWTIPDGWEVECEQCHAGVDHPDHELNLRRKQVTEQ